MAPALRSWHEHDDHAEVRELSIPYESSGDFGCISDDALLSCTVSFVEGVDPAEELEESALT